jgi:hypothetical protein
MVRQIIGLPWLPVSRRLRSPDRGRTPGNRTESNSPQERNSHGSRPLGRNMALYLDGSARDTAPALVGPFTALFCGFI